MSRKYWTDEKLFFRLLNNQSDKTYWDNIRELRSRPSDSIFNSCLKLIHSSKAKERTIGIDILAQLGIPPRPFFKAARNLFFEMLEKEKDPEVLRAVLYAVGHNNKKLKKTDIAILVSFKNNAQERIREGLVSALLSVDNKSAIDTLIYLSADKIAAIRDWATFGIGTLIEKDNKLIRAALWLRTADKDRATKFEAILGLAKRKDERIKEKIMQELSQGQYDPLLFEAVTALNDSSFLPLLKQNLAKAQKDKINNAARIAAIKKSIAALAGNRKY